MNRKSLLRVLSPPRAAINAAVGQNPIRTVTFACPPYMAYDVVWGFISMPSVFPRQ